ncbi:MAG: hypothetical protein PHQ36_13340, partial [Anaerolineales bacterium]|nr:hypothetical protein [Anaerolineales bacterium]
ALTIQYTMASTHTWGGVNYANAFNASMTAVGVALLLFGAGIFASMIKSAPRLRGRVALARR